MQEKGYLLQHASLSVTSALLEVQEREAKQQQQQQQQQQQLLQRMMSIHPNCGHN
jgi:hypothetical protein